MIIDCKGLSCPLPVVETKKYFDSISSGEATVIVDNEIAKNNVIKLAEKEKLKVSLREVGNLFHIALTKGERENLNNNVDALEQNKYTIVISSNKMGEGDDDLGKILMKSYLFALSEADIVPHSLIFLNSGVYLIEENSNTLDSIKKLRERGVNILVCGTCIEFYAIEKNIGVGEVSNMYSIVEIMNEADKLLKI